MSKERFCLLLSKKESVDSIYHDFQDAISLDENPTKAKIERTSFTESY